VTTLDSRLVSPPAPELGNDSPRALGRTRSLADWVFTLGSGGIGTVVLIITSLIGTFLGVQMVDTIHRFGFHFFVESQWDPETNTLGISTVLLGTVEVAVIALTVSFPLALLVSLYISEYAPRQLKGTLIAAVDLMAAIPSVIYAFWGLLLIMPKALYISRFLATYLGWIPFLKVDTDPHAAVLSPHLFTQSPFIAGLIVSMMVIPMGAAVMLGVFRQAPMGEREAAFALGSTRWGMIRAVVLPFGRGGIIAGTMLALGRALGETVAVYLILSIDTDARFRPLEQGGVTVASLIANFFGDASNVQLSALLAAGFMLFLITFAVNTIAAIIVNRSRSGATTDI
jgi:phosphate transport system permease protein